MDRELIIDFLDSQKYDKLASKHTISSYKRDLELFNDYITARNSHLLSVDRHKLEQYRRYLLNDIKVSGGKKGYSPSTVARHIATLRSFYSYLLDKEYIEDNPMENIKAPRIPKREVRYLTEKQAARLIRATNGEAEPYKSRDKLMLSIFLTTGIRLDELANLQRDNITENILRFVGKGNKERVAILNDDVLVLLDRYLSIRTDSNNSLFISNRGRKMSNSTIQYTVEKYLKKSGLDKQGFSVHSLRHTAATIMHKKGVDIRTLQQLLGHSNIQTTASIYAHVDTDQLTDAASTLEGIFD